MRTLQGNRRSAVIVNQFTAQNAGDAAILTATTNLLRQIGYQHLCSASRFWLQDKAFCASLDVTTHPPIIPFPVRGEHKELLRLAQFAWGTILVSLILVLLRINMNAGRRAARRLGLVGLATAIDTDAVVLAGGGYVWSSKSRINLSLVHSMLQVKVAGALGKPIIMIPQSIGPIFRREDRRLLHFAFRNISPIIVRDPQSVEFMRGLMGPYADIHLVPDIVFHAQSVNAHERETHLLEGGPKQVAIVPMDWTHARDATSADLDCYIRKLGTITHKLLAEGHSVVLAGTATIAGQKEDDFRISRQIFDTLLPEEKVKASMLESSSNISALVDTFADSHLVIGTRLHGCIMALISGVPAIALAYSPKVDGTYSMLGLSDYCFDVQTFDQNRIVQLSLDILKAPKHSTRFQKAVKMADAEITAAFQVQE